MLPATYAVAMFGDSDTARQELGYSDFLAWGYAGGRFHLP